MKFTKRLLLQTACALASFLLLPACGKKEPEPAEDDGPQSTQGAILESVQKTVDEANARTRQVKEASDAATK
jgi:hypothetical protein